MTGSLSGALLLEQILFPVSYEKTLLLLDRPLISIDLLQQKVKIAHQQGLLPQSSGTLSKTGELKNSTAALQIFTKMLIHDTADLDLAYTYKFLKFMKKFTESVKRSNILQTLG